MEFLIVLAFFGYIYYLKNYADLRTKTEKELAALQEGIALYESGQLNAAFAYFDQRIKSRPDSCAAYLYRALCYKDQGNTEAAFRDLQTGMSYDDSLYTLHLETGKLYYEKGELDRALASFDKAVLHAGNLDPETYRWRGLTYRKLSRHAEAESDFVQEQQIIDDKKKQLSTPGSISDPFLNRRFLVNMILIIFTSAMLIAVIKQAESIHLPYLVAVFSAICIGFVEPRKGWLLAVLQSLFLVSGYFLFTRLPESGGRQEVENFSLYGSVILTFAASFLGSFLKRAINTE
ncbi:tetratricopeptide repeat protein [Dyadobacter flavalbus]|uniref:Tetratricopeptide repeat protein n=1 Tax=Dyadobacter flavalbus TaxID=2579942 RepID=A0A5M8QQF6_9BACT|nr:tetratricopeptide repeat protein [Dyadobacter flavalbus]KAA6436886.1 tetratricopeptide repeat protein [Dyadobacter flavalbus]